MNARLEGNRIPAPALALGVAGLLPFAAAALAQYVSLPGLAPAFGLQLGIVYGAIILSFLGGIRWGTAIGPYASSRQALEFPASVLGSLAGLAAIFMPELLGIGLLISGFLMQALWDVTSVEAGRLPAWFGKFRMGLTAGAVSALIAMLVILLD